MARLIVNVLPDPVMAHLRSQPGDVVDVVEDGHYFIDHEYLRYLVINIPYVPALVFADFKQEDKDANGEIIGYRKKKLDFAALDIEIARIRAKQRGPLTLPDIEANTKARI